MAITHPFETQIGKITDGQMPESLLSEARDLWYGRPNANAPSTLVGILDETYNERGLVALAAPVAAIGMIAGALTGNRTLSLVSSSAFLLASLGNLSNVLYAPKDHVHVDAPPKLPPPLIPDHQWAPQLNPFQEGTLFK